MGKRKESSGNRTKRAPCLKHAVHKNSPIRRTDKAPLCILTQYTI